MKSYENTRLGIHYWDTDPNNNSKPTLVLVHGNSGSSLFYRDILDSFLTQKYRLLAIDLPGHGESAKAEAGYSLQLYAHTIVEFAKDIGAQDAVFVGYGLGGHALLEAESELDQAKGFFLVGAPPLKNPANSSEAFGSVDLSIFFTGTLTQKKLDPTLDLILGGDSQHYDLVCTDFMRTDARARLDIAECVVKHEFKDEVQIVAAMKKPLALVVCEQSVAINNDYVRRLKAPSLWRGQVQSFNTKHFPALEDSSAFAQMVNDFVNDVRSESPSQV